MGKNSKKKHKKKTLVVGLIIAALVAFDISCYSITKNEQQSYTKSGGWLTYQSEVVPFTFDYPESWNLTKTVDSNNDTHIKYVVITASNQSTSKKIAEVKYYTYTTSGAIDKKATGTDCESKQGGYENKCSYVLNPLVEHGYFYHNVDTDYWSGKFALYKKVNGENVFDKTVSITLTLFDDSTSSKNDLINLAKSITAATN